MITNQLSGSEIGVIISPIPSAQALFPSTKTGMSAPSVAPSFASACNERSSFQSWLSARSVVAAFELPPPNPPYRGGTCYRSILTPV